MYNFKCRVCGNEKYNNEKYNNVVFYSCSNCSTMFFSPSDFSLNRQLKIKYLNNYNLKKWGELNYKHLYDSGIDLRAAIEEPKTIYPYVDGRWNFNKNLFIKIPFGISIRPFPKDMDVKIYNRSGLASKYGIRIRNNVGVIDTTYNGECMGVFENISKEPYTINPGDRVAQMVVEKRLDIDIISVDVLEDTDRGINGFGSTGKN